MLSLVLASSPNAAQWTQAGAAVVAVGIALLAAGFARKQVLIATRAHEVERTLAAHRDLTTGEVGACRDRFSGFMWGYGTRDTGENSCWTPRFLELNPDSKSEHDRSGELSEYPPWVLGSDGAEPLRDLYKILWCFERIETARRRRTLDDEMLSELVGEHAVWWDSLLRSITELDTRHRRSLAQLGPWALAKQPDLAEWCEDDF